MMAPVNGDDVLSRRLHSLRLDGAAFATPEEVVRWLGAVQSQDYAPAKWSIGQRLADGREPRVEQAFAAGAILRTHVLRPTWHFVLPEDIRWMLALTRPRVHQLSAYMYRQEGLDAKLLGKCYRVLERALQGGQQLTRAELGQVLARARITAAGVKLGYIMFAAELDALVCSGALRGKQHTYALLEERVPPARARDPDEALAELTCRYFTSHGPATAKDFHWWSSLTLSEIKRGLAMVKQQLEHEVVGGVGYWFAGTAPRRRPKSPRIHLLQAYDELSVGYTESKPLIHPVRPAQRPIDERTFNHLILLDGRLAGRWKRTLAKDRVLLETQLYWRFDRAQREALAQAADRHGDFLGVTAALSAT